VIGFGVLAFTMVLACRVTQSLGVEDLDDLKATDDLATNEDCSAAEARDDREREETGGSPRDFGKGSLLEPRPAAASDPDPDADGDLHAAGESARFVQRTLGVAGMAGLLASGPRPSGCRLARRHPGDPGGELAGALRHHLVADLLSALLVLLAV
jgi:hypothetical protein